MAIANVQGWKTNTTVATPASTISVGAGQGWAAPTAGNILIAVVNADDYLTSGVPSGFTAVVNQAAPANCGTLVAWKVAAGTETTVTATPASTVSACMALSEWSGMTSTPSDKISTVTVQTSQSSAALNTGTTATTAQADELLVAVWGSSIFPAAQTITFSGQTNSLAERLDIQTTAGSGTNVGLCVADLVVSATGAYSSAATPSSAIAGNAVMTTWKAATAAAFPFPPGHLHKVPIHRAANW